MTQLLELHALDDLAVADVHAGDDALGQHQAQTSRKLRRIVRPASPDFSGWNCTPKMLSRSTTDENVLACVVDATHSLGHRRSVRVREVHLGARRQSLQQARRAAEVQ